MAEQSEVHSDKDFRQYFEAGMPAVLPAAVREAYIASGMAIPVYKVMVSAVTPPPSGFCDLDGVVTERNPAAVRCEASGRPHSHCVHGGEIISIGDYQSLHAVANAENATHPVTGAPLRLLADHCAAHARSEHCDPHTTSPGSGHPDGSPSGWCEYAPSASEVRLSVMLLPMPTGTLDQIARVLRRRMQRLHDLILQATIRSQGQQVADLQGSNNSIGASSGADSTAGHGMNVGAITVYKTVSAPANANTAVTGADLLATVAMPATAFGTASAALPSVLTANAISSVSISATGTASYARLCAQSDDGLLSTSERRLQFSCTAGGADLSFNTYEDWAA